MYRIYFYFYFFPASDLKFLAKMFEKQEIKLFWPRGKLKLVNSIQFNFFITVLYVYDYITTMIIFKYRIVGTQPTVITRG